MPQLVETEITDAGASNGAPELSVHYDRGDARLGTQLALHITDRGDPLVRVRLKPNADAKSVLARFAAAGSVCRLAARLLAKS